MADFVQTMKDWKRMCNAMGQEDEYSACEKCGLKAFGCPAIYEKECDSADWNHVEEVVTAWAAEHPEPVYPTWVEYFRKIGIAPEDQKAFHSWLMQPIPADIAQKLGIEPKEDKPNKRTKDMVCGNDYCELE
jgi:hypothetical protein